MENGPVLLTYDRMRKSQADGRSVALFLQESVIEKGWGLVRGPASRLIDAREKLLQRGYPPEEVMLAVLGDQAIIAAGIPRKIYASMNGRVAREANPFTAPLYLHDVGIQGPKPRSIHWLNAGITYDPV